ncbi:MAG: hypothetical protein Q9184_002894 [Pyrenodesmia sp. 2 TL-2023]
MTPKKTLNRRSHPLPHARPSSPDSDHAIPQSSKTPISRTNQALNLSVLRRHLPSTTALISLAPYAVIYTFSAATSTWEKSGIEGTLFICAQTPLASTNPMSTNPLSTTAPRERYSVVVLNRKGLRDFVCPLRGDVDFEAGYIILRGMEGDAEGGEETEGQRIWGIWIFEEEEGSTRGIREANARIVRECAARAAGKGGGAIDGYRDDVIR